LFNIQSGERGLFTAGISSTLFIIELLISWKILYIYTSSNEKEVYDLFKEIDEIVLKNASIDVEQDPEQIKETEFIVALESVALPDI
jgi:RNA recognition motif-containing protein